MNSQFFRSLPLPCLLYVITLVSIIEVPVSSTTTDYYTSCRKLFTCGNIATGYPFWGNDRVDHCGHPKLKLDCNNDITIINNNGHTYRVLHIDNDTQTLKIAREDYLDGICPPQIVNASVDDPLLFDYAPGYRNLTIYYNCLPFEHFASQFTCPNAVDGYVQILPRDLVACSDSVIVPLSETLLREPVNPSAAEEALREGFEVKWNVDNRACQDCTESNGTCGFDPWNQTTCYCPNQRQGLFHSCSSPPGLMNLTIFYKCNLYQEIPNVPSALSCPINGTNINAYYAVTGSTAVQGLRVMCNSSVIVPIFESVAQALVAGSTNIFDALDEGFELQWRPSNDQCNTCMVSGGQCGYNRTSSQFTCFCKDQPSNAAVCSSKPSGDNKISMKLGLGIGIGVAGSAGIFLAFWFLLIKRRRKKMVIQSKSKEITPPSSSNPTPSTNLSQSIPSQSIPSYPSSNFDLEKGSSYFGAQVFSFTELEEATDNFDPSKELGDGGFGTVYHGKLNDGRVVAVKRLYENNFKRAEQFMNEVEILTRLRHPNLVILFGCTSRRSRELLLVYEYIPNGTVADHLHGSRARSGLLTWPIRLSIAIETANALAYLHASDVIHRDVKTNNILLDNNFRVKVADFGLSRLFPTDVTHVSTAPQGTPGYVDPEYYQCYKLTDKSDVYSFGVVLVELISSKEAVDTTRHRHDINLSNMAVNRIQTHALHELIDPRLGFEKNYVVRTMITSVAELAFRCLQQDRDLRPSMEEVLAVLKEIVNEELRTQKAEVVDISADDVGLLQSIPPPHSPDSEVNDKWVSSSNSL